MLMPRDLNLGSINFWQMRDKWKQSRSVCPRSGPALPCRALLGQPRHAGKGTWETNDDSFVDTFMTPENS